MMEDQPLKMQTPSEHGLAPDSSPLYVRWNPERSPYAIELKLDIASSLARHVRDAERINVEIGGILVGTFPPAGVPTLRIEGFELFQRDSDENQIFMLGPQEHERLAAAQARARRAGRSVLGFFRSHMRPGPLRPSLADRTLFGTEFKEGVQAILMIQGTPPQFAAFFIGARGQLSEEPAVREFRFNESDFGALPEVEPSWPTGEDNAEPAPVRGGWYILIAVLLIAVVAAGLYIWSVWTGTRLFPSRSGEIALAVTGGRTLHITWNHSAPDVTKAESAKLVIIDGDTHREVQVGLDELRLGTVDYERTSDRVQVTLMLAMPGATSLSQSVAWHS